MVNFNSNRTFGIEIEMSWGDRNTGPQAPSQQVVANAIRMAGLECNVVNSYSNAHLSNSNTAWKIVRDGSVTNGHELVSPILRGLNGKEQLQKAMQAVKSIGAVVHESCGVHVHHGVHEFTAKQLANIAEIWRNNEQTIDKLVSVSRRNVHWARSMDNGVSYFENVSAITFNGEWSNSHHDLFAKNSLETAMVNGKYYKVNFRAFVRQGTVEFRQHQSSLNATQIWNWVVFTQMVVESAKGKRGKANPVTVNTGNQETAGERALIRDLNMRKRTDPRTGRQNYDDVTMNALRGLAKKRQVGMVNRHGQNMEIGLSINLRAGAVEEDSEINVAA